MGCADDDGRLKPDAWASWEKREKGNGGRQGVEPLTPTVPDGWWDYLPDVQKSNGSKPSMVSRPTSARSG